MRNEATSLTNPLFQALLYRKETIKNLNPNTKVMHHQNNSSNVEFKTESKLENPPKQKNIIF